MLLGIVAATLIPNLLPARERATDMAREAQVDSIYKAVIAMDAEGGFKPGHCLDTTGTYLTPDMIPLVRACLTEQLPTVRSASTSTATTAASCTSPEPRRGGRHPRGCRPPLRAGLTG